jgi:hypothetical protein
VRCKDRDCLTVNSLANRSVPVLNWFSLGIDSGLKFPLPFPKSGFRVLSQIFFLFGTYRTGHFGKLTYTYQELRTFGNAICIPYVPGATCILLENILFSAKTFVFGQEARKSGLQMSCAHSVRYFPKLPKGLSQTSCPVPNLRFLLYLKAVPYGRTSTSTKRH